MAAFEWVESGYILIRFAKYWLKRYRSQEAVEAKLFPAPRPSPVSIYKVSRRTEWRIIKSSSVPIGIAMTVSVFVGPLRAKPPPPTHTLLSCSQPNMNMQICRSFTRLNYNFLDQICCGKYFQQGQNKERRNQFLKDRTDQLHKYLTKW